MRLSTINTLVESLAKEVEAEQRTKRALSTKEKALRKALTESKQAIDRNNHRGARKVADYRRSFEELLESYYPGKPWYAVTSINIDDEFAMGNTPEQIIAKIVENINKPVQKKTKLNESKTLQEGSRAQKALQALKKLKGSDSDMYEELDYDEFDDEVPEVDDFNDRVEFDFDIDVFDDAPEEEVEESLTESDDLPADFDDEEEPEVIDFAEEPAEEPEAEEEPVDEPEEAPAEEEPVEDLPEEEATVEEVVAEKIEEIKELIDEIEEEFDDEIWDDEIEDDEEAEEPEEEIQEEEPADDIEDIDDIEDPEAPAEEPEEEIQEGVRADKAKIALGKFRKA